MNLTKPSSAQLVRIDPSDRPSPVAVYLQAKPGMAGNLRVVLRLLGDKTSVRAFPWQDLRYEHVSAIRSKLLADQLAPSYARKCLVAVRGVLHVAWKMGAIDEDTRARACSVEAIKGDPEQAGRMLSKREIRQMLTIPEDEDPDAIGWRDSAIVSLAAYCGLRREEISKLDLASFNEAEVLVQGKGAKRRSVFLPDEARIYLDQWLVTRGPNPGPCFWRARRGGKLCPGRRLSPSGMWEVIVRRALGVGVKNVTPHDFRRTYASTLFDMGVDPVTVQKLMGHDDPKTTAGYDRRGNERKIEAAEALARAYGRP